MSSRFADHVRCFSRVLKVIGEKLKPSMMQTACCGKFSSDRTIEEYVKDIWKLEKVEVPSGQEE